MTVRDLIKRALRLIDQLGPGQDANTSETADALLVLNSYVEWLRTNRLNVPALEIFDVALSGAGSYTIGTGGDFNRARPLRIERAVLSSGAEIPVLTRGLWTKGQSYGFYYEPSFPLGTIYVHPDPAETLELHAWGALSAFSAATDTIALPPGYTEFLAYNLAVRLGLEWGKPVRPEVADLARTTLAEVESVNAPSPVLRCDPAMTAPLPFDILRGF